MADSFFGFDPSASATALDDEIYDLRWDELVATSLDEGAFNDFNDETFGDSGAAAPGRDFDFAGSTSKYLPTPPPVSPWSALDADPLLAGGPISRTRFDTPSAPSPVYPSQPPRRTLEEIEAEQRAQASAQYASRIDPRFVQPPPPARQQMTLEQVEAEMRNARARGPPPSQQEPSPPQFQQPPFPPQFYAPSPQMQPSYLPSSAPVIPQQLPQPYAGQQFMRPPGMGQFPPGALPPHLMQQQQPQQQQRQQSPQLPPQSLQQAPQSVQQAPQSMQQQMPPPVPLNSMLTKLFPPLPSQATPVTVEQQLQYLTMNQHAQHPLQTGAQLQALLQQAHSQANASGAAKDVEGAASDQVLAGEELIRSVEARIREHEMLEQGRKRKAHKIASMAKYNNIMSNSDKDFITRIQVSQLVTDDPYADDFYFHIMAAIKSSRNAAARNAELAQAQQNGNAGRGPQMDRQGGNGPRNARGGERKPTRRENAMNKMASNVQRLVDVAKQRNKSGLLSLDGALGKIALRTRSAPRQLLQVSAGAAPSAGHTLLAGLISHTAGTSPTTTAGAATDGHRAPMTHRAVLIALEQVYDSVLDLEQLKRVQSNLLGAARHAAEMQERGEDASEMAAQTAIALEEWDIKYAELSAKLWTDLRVMEPLDSSLPHPFISLVSVLKGKRILPRALRHTTPEQTLTLLTLMVATFDTLDTVRDAPLLDVSDNLTKQSAGSLEGKQRRAEVDTKTDVFLQAIISPVMAVIGRAPLRMVTGMLGLMLERNDILKVVRSKPGVAFLTVFLTRAESLKQELPAPEAQDLLQWQQIFAHFFNLLSNDFPSLFPSTRAVASLPFGAGYYLSGQSPSSLNALRPDIDLDDEPVWRFLAATAVCADPNEQQILVTAVRDKVLEHVTSTTKLSPAVVELKIRNVNLLLNSLGLDASDLRS